MNGAGTASHGGSGTRVGAPGYGAGIGALPGVTPPRTPTAGAAPTAGGPAQLVPDAQFLAEQARAQFERQTQIDQYASQSRDDVTNTQEAIRRLLQEVPDSRNTIKGGANKEGLLYSGQLGKRLDDYQAGVTRQQTDLNTGQQQREEARAAARAALERGASIDEAAALAALAERRIGVDQTDASLGALAPTQQPAQPPAAAGGTPRPPRPGPRPRPRRPRPSHGGTARRVGANTASGAGRLVT